MPKHHGKRSFERCEDVSVNKAKSLKVASSFYNCNKLCYAFCYCYGHFSLIMAIYYNRSIEKY